MQETTVGAVAIAALTDSHIRFPAAAVYESAGPELERYADLLEAGNIQMICGCALLRADGRTVLVDTGNGPAGSHLLDELAAAGVSPADVEIVVFTHLHGDHIGLNIDPGSGRPTFPNATYLISELDWETTRRSNVESWGRLLEPLQTAGVLELFRPPRQLTPSLGLVHTPGHTPGHTSIEISSKGERAFVLGDAVVHAISLAEPDWPTRFDADHERAAQTRHELIPRLLGSGELVIASHLGSSGLGHLAQGVGHVEFRDLPRGD